MRVFYGVSFVWRAILAHRGCVERRERGGGQHRAVDRPVGEVLEAFGIARAQGVDGHPRVEPVKPLVQGIEQLHVKRVVELLDDDADAPRTTRGEAPAAVAGHIAELLGDPVIGRFGVFADALPRIGDVQVRNRGTIGGSVAHADPAADLPAVLLALDAVLIARSAARGDRSIDIADFFTSSSMIRS